MVSTAVFPAISPRSSLRDVEVMVMVIDYILSVVPEKRGDSFTSFTSFPKAKTCHFELKSYNFP